jgi:hypothetical protein
MKSTNNWFKQVLNVNWFNGNLNELIYNKMTFTLLILLAALTCCDQDKSAPQPAKQNVYELGGIDTLYSFVLLIKGR